MAALLARIRHQYTPACIRAVRTALQAVIGVLTVDVAVSALDWATIVTLVAVPTLVAFLQGVLGALPEVPDA